MPAPAPMSCPHCAIPLVMSERQGIEIDYCPTCRGIWLDRGELDKILERAAADTTPAAPQPPRAPQPPIAPQAPYPPQGQYDPRYDQGRHHDQGHGRHHKRRKSWLEEIFD
ncbi:MAG TPA: zf-TFIIB domain-containing protein [Allosphingosinicella sp.]|nr:zf-TFIIB domain-containing protein [Allosphingosinicella sp.]